MGWNATVMICVDSLDKIRHDHKFGENLAKAVSALQMPSGLRECDVPAYSYHEDGTVKSIDCNAATAIEMHHADGYAIVAVGGNNGVKLGECYYTGFPDNPESKLKVIKQLADDLGYNLTRKPRRNV